MSLFGLDLAAQNLDRDLAVELRVVGGVDLAHAAAADPIQNDIAAESLARRQVGVGLGNILPDVLELSKRLSFVVPHS